MPDELLTRLKVVAAQEDTSISAMMTNAMEERADEVLGYRLAVKELLEDAEQGYEWGIGDKPNWTREELYERKP
jgi:predicted transcriptional regulator